MDILFIEKLEILATVGLHDWERLNKQKLLIDIEITQDQQLASRSDDINNCINYDDIINSIVTFMSDKSFFLIERVAEEISQHLINKFNIASVKISVSKLRMITQAQTVGVIIKRYKKLF